jgi:hypothetical protein
VAFGKKALAAALLVVLSLVGGFVASTPIGPLVVLGVAATIAFAVLHHYVRVPMVSLLVLFIFAGYVLLNRNFAELQIRVGELPIYVGELLLAISLPWAVLHWPRQARPVSTVWVVLGVWLTYATGRLLGGGLGYGLDAIRDFAMAYYALYILVGYAVWSTVPRVYWTRFFTALFVVMLPIQAYVVVAGPFGLPFPGSDENTLVNRQDVMAVSLIVAATFFVLVLRTARLRVARVVLASLALALVLPQEVRSATMGAVVLLGIFAVQRRWGVLLSLVALPVAAFALISLAGVELRGRNGSSSPEVWVSRQVSTVSVLLSGDAVEAARQGVYTGQDVGLDTVAWRLAWWNALLEDASSSVQRTLVGRGFGADLTEPLGFQPDPTNPRLLRSPHNFVLTLLARTGVVGLVLWLSAIACWAVPVLLKIRAAMRHGRHADADYVLWLTVYPMAILVAAMFGVVLEGPYGAIPCYLLIGMSLRAAEALAEEPAPVAVSTTRLGLRKRLAIGHI